MVSTMPGSSRSQERHAHSIHHEVLFTIKDKSDMLGEHRHACSDLSFVYYLTGGQLCFKQEWNANQYGGMLDAKPPERSHIDNETFFTTKVAATTVAPGDLLVFPSNLLHFVMPEEGTDSSEICCW